MRQWLPSPSCYPRKARSYDIIPVPMEREWVPYTAFKPDSSDHSRFKQHLPGSVMADRVPGVSAVDAFASRQRISEFLLRHSTAYDLLPESGKVRVTSEQICFVLDSLSCTAHLIFTSTPVAAKLEYNSGIPLGEFWPVSTPLSPAFVGATVCLCSRQPSRWTCRWSHSMFYCL